VVVTAFRQSLSKRSPPKEYAPALQALWWAEKDDWSAAHAIVMAHDDADSAWVHAHLHRAEGDLPQRTLLVPPGRQESRHRNAGGGAQGDHQGAGVSLLFPPRFRGG